MNAEYKGFYIIKTNHRYAIEEIDGPIGLAITYKNTIADCVDFIDYIIKQGVIK